MDKLYQIARLNAGRIAAFNHMFEACRDLFDYFGYDAMKASGAASTMPALLQAQDPAERSPA